LKKIKSFGELSIFGNEAIDAFGMRLTLLVKQRFVMVGWYLRIWEPRQQISGQSEMI